MAEMDRSACLCFKNSVIFLSYGIQRRGFLASEAKIIEWKRMPMKMSTYSFIVMNHDRGSECSTIVTFSSFERRAQMNFANSSTLATCEWPCAKGMYMT